MIKGILFDMDGTLLESMHIWRSAASRYVRSQGLEPESDLQEVIFTMSVPEGCAYLRENYFPGYTDKQIEQGILDSVQVAYDHEIELKPGAKEALEALHQRGIPMAICTSSDVSHAEAAFTRLGVRHCLRGIFSCREAGVGKSDPTVYFMACKALGFTEISEIAVVEDALYALRTAKKAGFFAVGLPDDSNLDVRRQVMEEADLYVEGVFEWRKIIGEEL